MGVEIKTTRIEFNPSTPDPVVPSIEDSVPYATSVNIIRGSVISVLSTVKRQVSEMKQYTHMPLLNDQLRAELAATREALAEFAEELEKNA